MTLGSNILGASAAEAGFSQLLTRVEGGEEFTITKDGAPVARLVPVRSPNHSADRPETIKAMRRLAARNRLAGLPIRALIDEGRK